MIRDHSGKTWGFDISDVKYVSSPENELTDIFNFILLQEDVGPRLVSLYDPGFECLIFADPFKVKAFAEEIDISLIPN